ncbi:MAG: alpha/beta fold hydrolase [Pseudomonas sp.]|uniref:alpha/beta hydrolase n=1 Tax=Pseudomonas sp. TaxID=306 RepID=UPI0033961F44
MNPLAACSSLLLAALLGAVAPAAQALAASAPCPFRVADGLSVSCGQLELPASRSERTLRRIQLFYARVAAAHDSGLEPLLVLTGGPGIGASQLLESGPTALLAVQATRELIFVDQRGTGRSLPDLRCPDMDPVALYHDSLSADEVQACLKRLREQGFRTAWFDTQESAQDLQALRQHLGIQRWALHGTSYGTVLALELLRRDAAAVSALVLISPTQANAYLLEPDALGNIGAVWRRIFVDCAAQPECARAYPDLQGRFLSLAAHLTRQPLHFTFKDPRSGQPRRAQMGMAQLLAVLNGVVGSEGNGVLAPALIDYMERVASGRSRQDDDKLAQLYLPPGSAQAAASTAPGLNLSITCREARPRHDEPALLRVASAFEPYAYADDAQQYSLACPLWQAGDAAASLYQAPRSAVPTLLLTGDYDTLAGSYHAARLQGGLSRSQLLSIRGAGHDVTQGNACASAAVVSFLAAPLTPLAAPCLRLAAPPAFQVFDFGAPPATGR